MSVIIHYICKALFIYLFIHTAAINWLAKVRFFRLISFSIRSILSNPPGMLAPARFIMFVNASTTSWRSKFFHSGLIQQHKNNNIIFKFNLMKSLSFEWMFSDEDINAFSPYNVWSIFRMISSEAWLTLQIETAGNGKR